MAVVAVNLHTHESTASPDSSTSIPEMMHSYRKEFKHQPMIGFVGHDDVGHDGVPKGSTPCNAVKGVEHTIDQSIDLHVVEYPEYDFKFLAHPGYTWGSKAKEKAREFMERNDIHAVEKFRAGNVQYEGRMNAVELAGDDAHNPRQTGTSYMLVSIHDTEPEDVTWSQVFSNIKEGNMKLVNNPAGAVQSVLGDLQKGLSLMK